MITFDLNHCSNRLLQAMAEESKNAENIQQILEFKEDVVYKAVASNVNASTETLFYLYKKYGDGVSWTLAENESTPHEVLHEIAEVCGKGLATVLLRNSELQFCDINILVERYLQEDETVIETAIKHNNISAGTLIKISNEYPKFAEEILLTEKVKFVEK